MLFIKKLHAIKKYVTHLSLTKVSNVEADEQLSFKSRYKSLCSSAVVLEQLSSVIFGEAISLLANSKKKSVKDKNSLTS